MAVLDYYKTLGLTRASTDDEVRKAYRNLALKFHPLRNRSPTAKASFAKVAESFDVLGDGGFQIEKRIVEVKVARKRAIYDQYGQDGLVRGVHDTAVGETYPGGYTFEPTQSETLFLQFFGVSNPFDDLFAPSPTAANTQVPLVDQSVHVKGFGTVFGGIKGMAGYNDGPMVVPKQPAPREVPLKLTLEQLYRGCIKKCKISRKILSEDGKTTVNQDKTFTVEVKKGWKNGTRVIFPKEADQAANQIPADLVFVVEEIPHATFKRQGHNLLITRDLTLKQALLGTHLTLATLDDRQLQVAVSEVVAPGHTKIIPGEGMPKSKEAASRGDLVVHFNVAFPTYLSTEQKKWMEKALE